MADAALLKFEKINKYFSGVHALKNIDLLFNRATIHCLAGENGSGKSTLVKIASGIHRPSSGHILLNGNKYERLTPVIAMEYGVQVIYQDLSLFAHMSLAENIAISKIHRDQHVLSRKHINEIAEQQISKLELELNLNATARESSMGNRQVAAICRALAMDAQILFMDEPTTALSSREVDKLLEIIIGLKNSGLSIIFISHKLDEILKISDLITVFRDGDKIGDFTAGDMTANQLSFYMTGKDLSYSKYQNTRVEQTPLLKVRKLKANKVSNISLELNQGDIVGLVGLQGSGRSEFALSLFGLNPARDGEILLHGRKCQIKNTQIAKKYGIALLPEDRGTQGLFLEKTICENISSAMIDQLVTQKCFFAWRKERSIAKQSISMMNIKTPSMATLMEKLSGGNQQKASIVKWIQINPSIFIMDSPTVGIDIGSKIEIYNIIQNLALDGLGIILISDEVEEIIANCNKVAIFSNGTISRILNDKNLNDDRIKYNIQKYIKLDSVRGANVEES